MSARKRLAAIWLVFGLLLATIVWVERSGWGTRIDDGHGHANEDPSTRLLVRLPLEQIGAIEILDRGTVHRFERDANGAWFYHGVHDNNVQAHEHRPDPKLSERIERALVAFSRTRLERKLPGREDVQKFGLAMPNMLIFVYRGRESVPMLQVAVGDVAPDTLSRYIVPMGTPWVMTIANYQIENLLELVRTAQNANADTTRAGAS